MMCAITYTVYFKDKLKARKGLPRTSERALLTLGVIGGAIGALVAMKKHRHKTRHIHFYLVNIFSIALHIAAAILIFLSLI